MAGNRGEPDHAGRTGLPPRPRNDPARGTPFQAGDLTAVNDALGLCAADINGDGLVDAADLGLLIGAWGPCD